MTQYEVKQIQGVDVASETGVIVRGTRTLRSVYVSKEGAKSKLELFTGNGVSPHPLGRAATVNIGDGNIKVVVSLVQVGEVGNNFKVVFSGAGGLGLTWDANTRTITIRGSSSVIASLSANTLSQFLQAQITAQSITDFTVTRNTDNTQGIVSVKTYNVRNNGHEGLNPIEPALVVYGDKIHEMPVLNKRFKDGIWYDNIGNSGDDTSEQALYTLVYS